MEASNISRLVMDFLTSALDAMNMRGTDKPDKNQLSEQASYSYPEYHPYISEQMSSMSWSDNSNQNGHIREHDTNIMGSFECTNIKCNKRGWSSKKIAITIRLYKGNKYNTVVYNQRCKGCNRLGCMAIDIDSYTDRVVYRLKKWLGFNVEAPQHFANSKGPHQSSLCEGCKVGHCPQRFD